MIESLTAQGYTWTPYFSGEHKVNLADAAVFNGKKLSIIGLHVLNGEKVEMKNMETDFINGTYEVRLVLSDLKFEGDPQNEVASFDVIREAGDKVHYQEWLLADFFDANGDCVWTTNFKIGSWPKVTYSIETADNASLTIKEITWRRIQ